MSLEIFAMNFLRYQKHCRVALFGRSPRRSHGLPDVLGITQARYLLEIEIKRSLSDFRANEKKPHIASHGIDNIELTQERYAPKWPKQFWYLVPCELVKKVEPWVPDWAGLMRGPGRGEAQQVYVTKSAPTNKTSDRLTTREMMELGHVMANQLLSDAYRIESLRSARGDWDPWVWFPQI